MSKFNDKTINKAYLMEIESKLRTYKTICIATSLIFCLLSIIYIIYEIKNIKDSAYEFYLAHGYNEPLDFTSVYVMVAVMIIGIVCFVIIYTLFKMRTNEKRALSGFTLEAQETILSNDENIYSKSIKMSYTYLNKYYAQTQEQASKGFFVTVIISLFGAIIIILGILSMYFGITEPAYITVATGALTEIISSVFFYLYNKTITSMSKYHDKLVLSQNVAYALEIVDTISDNEKDEAKKELMRELVKDINLHLQKSDQD